MGGFAGVALEPVVAQACASHPPRGIVFGSGFDDCPRALVALARHAPVLGRPGGLSRAKNPHIFARACLQIGIAHPEISTLEPETPSEWLVKRRGGSGGLHVSPAQMGRRIAPGEYYQRRVDGRSISLLFVQHAQALRTIAWSEQWTAPSANAPYRYGGATGPVETAPPDDIYRKLAALTLRLGIRGLVSADFIDNGERLWLLELNPRPGATLDVFDDDDDPLLACHIAACCGKRVAGSEAAQPQSGGDRLQ